MNRRIIKTIAFSVLVLAFFASTQNVQAVAEQKFYVDVKFLDDVYLNIYTNVPIETRLATLTNWSVVGTNVDSSVTLSWDSDGQFTGTININTNWSIYPVQNDYIHFSDTNDWMYCDHANTQIIFKVNGTQWTNAP